VDRASPFWKSRVIIRFIGHISDVSAIACGGKPYVTRRDKALAL
jgi:hypothetical protein